MATLKERISPVIASNLEEDKLDVTQPLLFKVGLLGEKYDSWVHKPEPSRVRLFESDLLESISSCPWYVVPFWLLFAWCAVRHGKTAGCLTWGHACLYLCCGLLLWQPMEYGVHRYIFHAKPVGYWAITLHFALHGMHHKCPMDPRRLVFPPPLIGLLMAVVYKVLGLLLPSHVNWCVGSGLIVAYVIYDCMHYMFHHTFLPFSILGGLKTKHLAHHYKNHDMGFGVTNDFLDAFFKTI